MTIVLGLELSPIKGITSVCYWMVVTLSNVYLYMSQPHNEGIRPKANYLYFWHGRTRWLHGSIDQKIWDFIFSQEPRKQSRKFCRVATLEKESSPFPKMFTFLSQALLTKQSCLSKGSLPLPHLLVRLLDIDSAKIKPSRHHFVQMSDPCSGFSDHFPCLQQELYSVFASPYINAAEIAYSQICLFSIW